MTAIPLFLVAILSLIPQSSVWALQGHNMPIGNSGPNYPIDEATGFVKPAVFLNDYLHYEKPLIMRGAAKHMPAFTKWTDAYMRGKVPLDAPFKVIRKKYAYDSFEKKIRFSEFIDSYNTSDLYSTSDLPKELREDIILPFSIQCSSLNDRLSVSRIWMSSGGTRVYFHMDGYANIMCMIRGRKHIVLANASEYESILPHILDGFPLGTFSKVDPERVDLYKYPHFIDMNFYVADLEPGDCMYLPGYWFHYIQSLGSNIAVNIWFAEGLVGKLPHEKWQDANCDGIEEVNTSLTLDKVVFLHEQKKLRAKENAREMMESDIVNLDIPNIEKMVNDVVMNLISTFRKVISDENGDITEDEVNFILLICRQLDVTNDHDFTMADFGIQLSEFQPILT